MHLFTTEKALDTSIEIDETPESNSSWCSVEVSKGRVGFVEAVVGRSFGYEAGCGARDDRMNE